MTAKRKSNIKKWKVHFSLFGRIVVSAKTKKSAENKAYKMPIKKLLKNAKWMEKEEKNDKYWHADEIKKR